MKKKLAIVFTCLLLFSFGNTVQAATIDISLVPSVWSLSPYAAQDTPSPILSQVGGDLRGTISTANGGSGYGMEIETNDKYNFQNATLRFKWLVGLDSYSEASTHLSSDAGNVSHYIANNGISYGFNTNHSYEIRQLIENNTFLYTEITYNPSGLDYTVSYNDYGASPISSGTNDYDSAVWDRLDDAMFRFRLVDNHGAGQYFQLNEVTLITSETGPGPVPEPATMLLFGLGLLGVAGVSRRRE